MPSSTSSSETPLRRAGFPWALATSLVLLGLVEVITRGVLFPQGPPYHPGPMEYLQVSRQLESPGSAEVCILGSSRAREGFIAPRLHQALTRQLGRDVTVGNYACFGATSLECYWIARRLAASSRRPRLVLYGVTPRQFLGLPSPQPGARTALLWRGREWREACGEYGMPAVRLWPIVVQSWIKKHYLTLSLRDARKELAFRILGRPLGPNPVVGDLTAIHTFQAEQSMQSHPVDDADVVSYLRNTMGRRRYGNSDHVAILERTVRGLTEEGIEVVLVELPIAPILRRHYPPGTYDHFYGAMARLSANTGVRFLRLDELALSLGPEDFLEPSHLNLRGATKFTERVIARFILPELQAEAAVQQASQPATKTPGGAGARK